MKTIHDLARLLVASWVLAKDDEQRIPTSHGLLDRALQRVVDHPRFPAWAKAMLHFVDSRAGLQCVELLTILKRAQEAELTTAPNPTYRFTDVEISSAVARRLLRYIDVSEDDAREIGEALREAIAEAQTMVELPEVTAMESVG